MSEAAAQPKRRASERIAEELRREIIAGHPVDRTPALMARFGVSRPTLREAFRVLESEALIEVRHGSRRGVRPLRPAADSAARVTGQTLQALGTTIEQLYEAREAFDRAIALANTAAEAAHIRGQIDRLTADAGRQAG